MLNIREMRKAQKLSQADLGKRVGVSRYSILAWESGNKSPTLKQLETLANALGCSPKDLILEE